MPIDHESESANPSGLSKDQLGALEAQFSEWKTLITAATVAIATLFFGGTHFILVSANHSLADADGLTGIHLHYQQTVWWFFPGIGAISLSYEIVLQIWSIFIGRRIVGLYSAWAARQPKMSKYGGVVYTDSRKNLLRTTVLLTLPAGILTALALNMHTTFAEDGMHEYGYLFTSPRFYPYCQIRRIIQVEGVPSKNQGFIAEPHDVIDFADGHRWSQNKWDDKSPGITDALDATLEKHTSLQFLSAHTL